MTRSRTIAVLLCGLLAIGAASAKLGIESEAQTYLTGYYLFRGQPLGPFGLVRHGSFRLPTGRGFDLGLDGQSYIALSGHWRLGESRYTPHLDYRPPLLPVSFRAGWTWYNRLKWIGPETGEFSLRVTGHVPLNPWLEASYDHWRNVGLHLRGGVAQDWPTGGWGSLVTSASVGLDSRRGSRGFTDLTMRAGWRLPVGGRCYVEPALELVVPSHKVATYGARVSPMLGAGYHNVW